MEKPREWFLFNHGSVLKDHDQLESWFAYNKRRFEDDIHVIEYSAFERLKIENDLLRSLIDKRLKGETTE